MVVLHKIKRESAPHFALHLIRLVNSCLSKANPFVSGRKWKGGAEILHSNDSLV